MKRLLPGAVLLTLLGLGIGAAAQPHAPDAPFDLAGGVDVLEVRGVIDPSLQGYLATELAEAEDRGSLVILQIDSPGGYGDRAERLAVVLEELRVPVVAWIGPTGARAQGDALFLAYASGLVAVAPGAGLGPGRPFDLGKTAPTDGSDRATRAEEALVSLAGRSGADEEAVRRVVAQATAAAPALEAGAATLVAGNVPELLTRLEGRTLPTAAGPVALDQGTDAEAVEVRFRKPGPVRAVLHTGSTPTAVYLLVVLALWGIAFELTQPGVGMAGVAGVLALLFGMYGLTVVPVWWPGFAMLLVGTGLQGLDVVLRRLGVLTIAGTALFGVGSFLAWRGVAPAVDLAPWLIALMTLGGLLFFGFGMTVALRARQRVHSAQVGLVGLVGEARSDLDPEGGVLVKGALWRARSVDGPIPTGTRVRVRGIDGLILQVDRERDPPE